MVDKALVLENRRGILSSKHKQVCQSQQSSNSSPRINLNSSPARPIIRPIAQSFQSMPQPTAQEFVTPQRQMIPHPNLFQIPNTGNQSAQRTPTDHTSTFRTPTSFRFQTLGIRVLKGPRLTIPQPRTHRK
jgi:hypothetical protein